MQIVQHHAIQRVVLIAALDVPEIVIPAAMEIVMVLVVRDAEDAAADVNAVAMGALVVVLPHVKVDVRKDVMDVPALVQVPAQDAQAVANALHHVPEVVQDVPAVVRLVRYPAQDAAHAQIAVIHRVEVIVPHIARDVLLHAPADVLDVEVAEHLVVQIVVRIAELGVVHNVMALLQHRFIIYKKIKRRKINS